MRYLAAFLLLLTELAVAQFVAEPSNFTTKTGHAGIDVRFKEVPAGICEQNPNVRSYSGFADVAESEHIFWWFFEARNVDPSTAPLTIWINGGPGSSSMIGLFQENGPCGVDIDGNVYDNPYSWSNISNMIFIDQPTTTGFSYSVPVPGWRDAANDGEIIALPNATCPDYADPATCGTYNIWNLSLTANSTIAAAPNFYLTLQAFTGAFPEYASNGVYFATESYGGHYAPVFSRYIVEQNELNTTGTAQIDLRAVLIGNGWFDPILQYEGFYNYSSALSTQTSHPGGNDYGIHWNASYDDRVYNAMYGAGNCLDQLVDCNNQSPATNTSDGLGNQICAEADKFCYNQIEFPYDLAFERDEYDVRYLTPDPFPPTFYVDYLNREDIQAALGVYTNFTEGSDITGAAFAATGDDARNIGVTDAVEFLLDASIPLVLYFGDADYVCNWIGGEAFSYTLANAPAYTNGSAGFVNISTADGVVHGEVKTAGLLSFVRIYQSGHEVPFYQPLVALDLLNRTIQGVDIATGLDTVTPNYITEGPVDSTYVNGNGTVTFDVVPRNATYNTTTNGPNPPYDESTGAALAATGGSGRLISRFERVAEELKRVKRDEDSMARVAGRVVGRQALFETSRGRRGGRMGRGRRG